MISVRLRVPEYATPDKTKPNGPVRSEVPVYMQVFGGTPYKTTCKGLGKECHNDRISFL